MSNWALDNYGQENRQALNAELLSPLKTPIEKIKVSGVYKFGMFLIACMMFLIPLIYGGIIAATAWAIWYFSTAIVELDVSKGSLFEIASYFGPITAGCILLLFLIKPLFAPKQGESKPIVLDPEKEGWLFSFVEYLCNAVGAPVPKEIHVNADVNASASFRRGALSIIRNQLVLTIGLPLASGLSMQQLASILAHELGHFSQAAGMRSQYFINTINMWLTKVVYERDIWDIKLASATRQSPILLKPFLYLIRLMIWLTRRVLWVMMFMGWMVSNFMSRQMEYDADRYAARISGSRCFKETMARLPVMDAANQASFGRLKESWREERLGDDLCMLMMFDAQEITRRPDIDANLKALLMNSRQDMFSTHPSYLERFHSVDKENAPGIFSCTLSSRLLFSDFAGLSREATRHYYEAFLGHYFKASSLVPSAALIEEQENISRGYDILYRYFQGQLLDTQEMFLGVNWIHAPKQTAPDIQTVKKSRAQMLEMKKSVSTAVRDYQDAREERRVALIGKSLLEAGLMINPMEFGMTEATPKAAQSKMMRAENDLANALSKLEPFKEVAAKRLKSSIALSVTEEYAEKLAIREIKLEDANACIRVLYDLESVWSRIEQLRDLNISFSILIENLKANQSHEPFTDRLHLLSVEVMERTESIHRNLTRFKYPFAHAQEGISVGHYALKELEADPEDIRSVFHQCDQLLGQLHALYFRIMAELARISEAIESELDLPPLKDPLISDLETRP